MCDPHHLQATFLSSLTRSQRGDHPFRHWALDGCLPADVVDAIVHLPYQPAEIADTGGRRETHNETRVHFGPDGRARHAVMQSVADMLQDPRTIDAVEGLTGASLGGTYLRVEYCQDTGHFWLEPHTDIGVKRFTLQIYLNREPEAAHWGTDLYSDPRSHAGRAPAGFNRGLIFIPSKSTWHGFELRPLSGVRKSIIVNYVTAEWRNRPELSFPEAPIRQAGRIHPG